MVCDFIDLSIRINTIAFFFYSFLAKELRLILQLILQVKLFTKNGLTPFFQRRQEINISQVINQPSFVIFMIVRNLSKFIYYEFCTCIIYSISKFDDSASLSDKAIQWWCPPIICQLWIEISQVTGVSDDD